MTELAIAFGLVFVIEGLVWALAPGALTRMFELTAKVPETQIRTGGVLAVAFGVFIVWLVKG